ncbi:unnamed protein product [Amoebophrya sp. A120]|nr:unnamed protein product [Amoebophrya sp. A120]|eukprot:GSA120T00009788001.1
MQEKSAECTYRKSRVFEFLCSEDESSSTSGKKLLHD